MQMSFKNISWILDPDIGSRQHAQNAYFQIIAIQTHFAVIYNES